MGTRCVIDVDLADVFGQRGRKKLIRSVAWGDEVVVTKQASTHVEIETVAFEEQPDGSILPVRQTAFIEPSKSSGIKAKDVVKPRSQNDVLKVNFVDVQQGDGAVIETPDGKVILVDGGDNQLFARYLASRFRGTSAAKPRAIECIFDRWKLPASDPGKSMVGAGATEIVDLLSARKDVAFTLFLADFENDAVQLRITGSGNVCRNAKDGVFSS